MPGRCELHHDFPTIGDEHALAGANMASVFTQPILQLADVDGLHALNVAPCGYIVNAAERTRPRGRLLRYCELVRAGVGGVIEAR